LEFDRAAISAVKCPKCAHQGDVADFKEIPMKNIQCPYCKVHLKVAENEASKDIICPKCKHTIIATNEDKLKTEGPGVLGNMNKLYRPGKLELLKDEGHWQSAKKTVALIRGENTLGRKSPYSKSSIQLPTTDPFMSKNHAKIEVNMTPDSVFVHHFSDMNSANGAFHNNDRLEKDEVIKLMPGDTIRLGHTSLKFIE